MSASKGFLFLACDFLQMSWCLSRRSGAKCRPHTAQAGPASAPPALEPPPPRPALRVLEERPDSTAPLLLALYTNDFYIFCFVYLAASNTVGSNHTQPYPLSKFLYAQMGLRVILLWYRMHSCVCEILNVLFNYVWVRSDRRLFLYVNLKMYMCEDIPLQNMTDSFAPEINVMATPLRPV